MKVSGFELVEVIGDRPLSWKFKASVTVTRKRLFRKPLIEKREVFKTFIGYWHFIDNGECAPDEVDNLSRALEAKQGKDLPYCTTVKHQA